MKKTKMKKFLALFLCVVNVLGQMTPVMADSITDDVTESVETQAVEQEDILVAAEEMSATNIALGSTVTASAEYSTMPASQAVDGNLATRWSSEQSAPQYITVQLGNTAVIEKFRIASEAGDSVKIKRFTIKGSNDGSTYDVIYESEVNEAGFSDDFEVVLEESVHYQYIQLVINEIIGYPSVSLREFEIWGVLDEYVQDPSVNVAQGKVAVADGVEGGTSYTADKAFDGDVSSNASRWSQYGTNAHWIYVDLGREMDVNSVRLYWETRKATAYRIQTATTLGEWTDAKVIEGRPASRKDLIMLDSVQKARYVRLYIDSFTSEDPDGGVTYPTISIYEMEVYGGRPPVDVIEEITFVAPEKGDTKLVLNFPEVDDKIIKYNGTDYEQLVDRDLNIYQPIVDTVAKVSVKVTDAKDEASYEFKEMAVTIPGQYAVEPGDNAAPNVLPELREWKGHTGVYEIQSTTQVVYKEAIFKDAAEALAADYEELFGKTLEVVQADEAKDGDIFFKQTAGKGLFKEGYLLTVGNQIVVEAEEYTGAYWATRTILQSLKNDGSFPKGIARDYPLYEVRGFILDVGRKTFTMDYLKQVVQEMAWYKMNDFQVHLNDNYIFLERYTNAGEDPMTAYSGFRLESDIKEGGNGGLNKADLTNKDVFYTKDEFREFIKESRKYGVNIIPEIDVPAHSLAFTKVRPDLRHGTGGRDNDHFALTTKFDECVEFIQSVFDEYMGTDVVNPVFDEDTIVHIGCDEYSAGPAAFRNFSNTMIDYVQDRNRTVRMWGSLTSLKADVVVKSEDVQMNLWNFGWANMDQMYEEGFDLINCNDGAYYIVPNAGYYYDYLNNSVMYNELINSISGVTIPAGDEQMLGGAFAVWNDMVDKQDTGISEWDIYDRIKLPMALFGAKLWGKQDLSLNDAIALSKELGSAPANNFGYEVENTDGVIAHYPMDDMTAENLSSVKNAAIQEVDGKNALELKGNKSYVKTAFTTVGLGNDLRVKVKRTSLSNQEQILFESPYGSIKAVQAETGKVGFSRENNDYSFNYALPVNEWVELEFKNKQNVIQLYVNGELVDTLGDGEVVEGRPLTATMMFPVETIGSETKAFIGYVDDVRLGVAANYNSTMELDYALITADQVLAAKEDKELKEMVNAAKDILNTFAPSAEVIAEMTENITQKLQEVGLEEADYTKVNAYLALIPEDLSIYTEESVAALNHVKESIRMGLPKTMQGTVDGYEVALADALSELKIRESNNVNYVALTEISKFTASSSQGGQGPERVMDGDTGTLWHTDYGKVAEADLPHWIQIELKDEAVAPISELIYVPRLDGNTNGMFKDYEVQISSDGVNFETVTTGTWETSAVEKVITFATPIHAKYIRLLAKTAANNNGAAAEIKLRKAGIEADIAGLNALITKISAIEQGNYTKESWDALQSKLAEAKTLAGQSNVDANDVEIMKRELSALLISLRMDSTPADMEDVLVGYTLLLEGNIGVNFFMQLNDEVLSDDGAYMNFTLDGKECSKVYVKDAKAAGSVIQNNTECYVFKCGVPVKDMGTEITAQIILSDGRKGTEYKYKVSEYVDDILNSEGEYGEKTIKLVETMSSFGESATAYFADGEIDATPEMEAVTSETLKDYQGVLSVDSSYYGSSLLLKSDTILRHYFTEKVDGSTKKGDLYYIETEGIPAHELGKTIVKTVGDMEITYNPLSYAYIVLSRDDVDENLKNVMRAMYLYYQAAQEYKAVASE